MKTLLEKDLCDNTINLWSDYIKAHTNGNIFQSPVFYQTYKNTSGNKPIVIIAKNKDGKISGVLLAVVQKVISGILGSLTARSVIWGGPIYDSKEDLINLLESYNNQIKGNAIYTEIRNLFNVETYKADFDSFNYKFEDHLDILVDLTLNEEELWSQVHSKRRNEIRRARKENLVFKEETNINGLEKSYSILTEVYKQAQIPLVDFSFFASLLKNSNKDFGIKVFVAKNDDEVIGCMVTAVYNYTIYDLYAGSYRKFYKKYPNDLIPWEVFLWGQKNGYKSFDFGGAGKPNIPYGVRDYKKKFGGELVNFGRFTAIHRPMIYKLAVWGFNFLKKIKKNNKK